jgi:hypothetical protein
LVTSISCYVGVAIASYKWGAGTIAHGRFVFKRAATIEQAIEGIACKWLWQGIEGSVQVLLLPQLLLLLPLLLPLPPLLCCLLFLFIVVRQVRPLPRRPTLAHPLT